ncbi:predicted protein [Nematostella vectensis]|uniref:Glutathione S-transferase omega n=1 Tax=Nematostella vectensis TaxID=45351 RepID=A7RUN2_NEMVE|nr:predicted protein [Nematostella vectensis]|eukprot:XP_001636996.1 predicted protein [Nematostella vectensis]
MPITHISKGSSRPTKPKDKLRLYNMRFCPFAERARLVLAAKGLDYECVNVNLKRKPDWFQSDPDCEGKVPALETMDGKLIPESVIICEFLEDQYPKIQFYPSDPYLKSRQKLLIQRFDRVMSSYFRLLNGTGDAEENVLQLTRHFQTYEQELFVSNTVFFGGEKPGMLDYFLWPFFGRLPTAEHEFPMNAENLPKLSAWFGGMREDPAVKQVSVSDELLRRFARNMDKEEAQLYE